MRPGLGCVSSRVLTALAVLGMALSGCEGGKDGDAETPPVNNVAFVITTDFSTGSYAVVNLATQEVFGDLVPRGVHSDAIARFFGGRIYVVNRVGVDSIQVIDPQRDYTTPSNGEVSVGNGTNPQDIAFVHAQKAYVSRYASAALLIINPTTMTVTGEVDLRALTNPEDGDGVPEVAHVLMHAGRLYVALQHIDFTSTFPFTKVAPGEIAVIDPGTDSVVGVLALQGTNPFAALQYSPALGRILISTLGDFLVDDGGIEAIDPVTQTVAAGFVITEAAIGGDITHFEVVSPTRGYAIVTDLIGTTFVTSLVRFNPSTGQRVATLAGPLDVSVPHFAINSRGELYLAVTDTATPTPGLRVFSTATDTELTSRPLRVGTLPPSFVLFIEE